MAAAIRTLEPEIREAFKDAMARAASLVDVPALIEALEAGDVFRALELLRIDQSVLFPLQEASRSGYMKGAQIASESLGGALAGRWAFDGNALAARSWIEERGADLIESITSEGIASARAVISRGLADGVDHKKIARDLIGRKVGQQRVGGIIGLDSKMTDDVIRAQEILSDPDRIREYFVKDRKTGKFKPRYKLSDRRFDAQIKRAISEGRALSGPDLDKVIEAHKSKAAAYRGRRIARNEAHTALASGRDEAYAQILQNPDVDAVEVRWQHNLSQVPREDHVEMDGTVIEFGQSFEFPDGVKMKHPHDPAGGAIHSVGCRCIAVYRVKMRSK